MPTGWLGRFTLWRMNASHSRVTDWGLAHISVRNHDTILDVGCGGGRTIAKLAATAAQGKVYGIDHSEEAVAQSKRTNAPAIEKGRVDIRQASVAQLPFSAGMFDFVTAVETHFWWPDAPGAMRELLRVLKPEGRLVIIAEVYKGANTMASRLVERAGPVGLKLLTVEQHRQLFVGAGYSDIQVMTEANNGWICGMGTKPPISVR